MGKRYEDLEEAICKELEMLDKKYAGEPGEMSVSDVEKADKLYHALKSAETYHAMKDASEMEEGEGDMSGRGMRRRSYDGYGRSYARGRDSMGRFSRDMGGYSGNYPMYPPRYPMSYDDGGDWRY